jgi:hypothetical protein
MPTARSLLAALALTFAVGACNQDAPTSANTAPDGQQPPPEFKRATSKLLKNVPVTGTTVADVGGATGVFAGKVTITRFNFRDNGDGTGTLLVSGSLQDAAGEVVSNFTDIPATLTGSGSPTAPVCQILNLDIGPIHLNLLGLVVDLDEIHLDITGQTGQGQLLGNLLCGLAGLLDAFPGLGILQQILDILEEINDLLAGI